MTLKILTAFTSLAVFIGMLGLVEAVLRRTAGSLRSISADDMNYGNTYSDKLGWELIPDYEFVMNGALHTTNSLGYRGTEYPFERSPGKTRVVLTGDSLTYGYSRPDEQVFGQVLDDARDDLEIVNLSIQGYGTDQALVRLERDGMRFNPDVVVHGFCFNNDFQDNLLAINAYDRLYPKPYFTVEDGNLTKHDEHLQLPVFQRLAFKLASKSLLFNRLASLVRVDSIKLRENASGRQRLPPSRLPEYERSFDEAMDEAFEVTIAMLVHMKHLVADLGGRFIVVAFPERAVAAHPTTAAEKRSDEPATFGGGEDVSGDNDPAKAAIASATKPAAPLEKSARRISFDKFVEGMREAGIEVIDIMDELERRGLADDALKDLIVDDTFHLTRRGHELVAEILDGHIKGPH